LHEELNLVTGLCEAGSEDTPFVAEPLLGAAQCQSQRVKVSAAAVGQLNPLEVVPDAFGGVEVRRIARELLEVKALGGSTAQEVFDRLATMNGRAIPDHQELARDFAQQHAQEPDDIFGVVGALLGLQEEASLRRDPTDGGEMIMGERHGEHGRLAAGSPGADRHGEQIEAGLIYPDDGAAFLGRFFSSAGQRSCHQAWVARSLRCVARVRGCWTL